MANQTGQKNTPQLKGKKLGEFMPNLPFVPQVNIPAPETAPETAPEQDITNINLSDFKVAENVPDVGQVAPEIDLDKVGQGGMQVQPETEASTDIMESLTALIQRAVAPDESGLERIEEALLATTEELGERGGEQIRKELSAGIPELEKQRRDVQAQLAQVQAATTQGLVDEEGKIIPIEAITGRQGLIERQGLAKAQTLLAVDQVLSGNIETARSAIDRQLGLKYGQIESKMNTLENVLLVNQDRYNRQEKRAADQKLQEIDLMKSKLEAQRAREGEASNSVLVAMRNGLDPNKGSQLLSDLNAGNIDAESVYKTTGLYLKSTEDKLKERLMSLQITGAQAEINAMQQAQQDVERGILSTEQYKIANDLRKERNGLEEVKNAKNMEADTQSLLASLSEGTGPGDIAAINSFQRLAVDPGVAVREGDVALLQSAQSFGNKAWLKARGLFKGDKLTDTARAQMRDVVEQVYDARVAYVRENTQQIRNLAQEQGIDYSRYVGKDFSTFDEINSRIAGSNTITMGQPGAFVDSYIQSGAGDPLSSWFDEIGFGESTPTAATLPINN